MDEYDELLERLPTVDGKTIKEFQDKLVAEINNNASMPKWLNNRLNYLKENNQILYEQVVSRSQALATALLHYSSTQNQEGIVMSMTMEYIIMLTIIATGLPNKSREDFKKMMEDWGFSGEDFNENRE